MSKLLYCVSYSNCLRDLVDGQPASTAQVTDGVAAARAADQVVGQAVANLGFGGGDVGLPTGVW